MSSNKITSWITASTLVIGGIVTIFEYSDHLKMEKVDRTMTYMSRFNNEQLLNYRGEIENLQHRQSAKVHEILAGSLSANNSKMAAEYAKLVVSAMQSQRNKVAVDRLIDFYDELAICAEVGLCDATLAHELFDDGAKGFFTYFYPYICTERQNWNNRAIGSQLQTFFVETKDSQSCK